jgi:hypothetical protein
MQIRPPEWHLRADCPVCGQRSLLLVACPSCEHVAVVCEEGEGTAFIDTRVTPTSSAVVPEETMCPKCKEYRLQGFANATSTQILSIGLMTHDYY